MGAVSIAVFSPDLSLQRADVWAGFCGHAQNAFIERDRERDVTTDETVVAGVAGRYAAALFDLANESSKLPEVEADLQKFRRLLDESPDLVRLVRSPVVRAEDQAKALAAIVDRAGLGALSGNFLKLLAKNRRLFVISDVISAFRALAAKSRGEATAEVTSAVALTDAQIAELKKTLKASVGKDVTLNARVDPSLLGGLVVKIGSRMVDSSIRTKLQSLKVALNQSGA